MIKGIIFDMDGLLVDTELVSIKVYQDMLEPYGFELNHQEYGLFLSGKTEEHNVRKLIERFNLEWDYEESLKRAFAIEAEALDQGVPLKKGAMELLSYLRDHHFKIAIASSSTRNRAIKLLKQHNIDTIFDAYVFAEDVLHGKPHPDVFLKAVERLELAADECLVLEDSEAGIQSALAGNISVICIPDMKQPSKGLIDQVVAVLDSLLDVIPHLENTNQC